MHKIRVVNRGISQSLINLLLNSNCVYILITTLMGEGLEASPLLIDMHILPVLPCITAHNYSALYFGENGPFAHSAINTTF